MRTKTLKTLFSLYFSQTFFTCNMPFIPLCLYFLLPFLFIYLSFKYLLILILKQIKVDLFLGCMMSLAPSPPSENLSSMPEIVESVDLPWQVGVGGRGVFEFIQDIIRARICKHLRSPAIDSRKLIPPAYVAWRAGTSNRVVVPARQAGYRFLCSLKGLQIRAQKFLLLCSYQI
jgi:hypothetical protein